jgi:HlyD family type I secretion membrane fusion protein
MTAADAHAFPATPFGKKLPAAGAIVLAVFTAGFAIWSAAAPLEGAVIAPGVVSVESSVRLVQHLEGGIVSKILVREGDRVRRGQPLVTLTSTAISSSLNELKAQYFDAVATEARLIAERDNAAQIRFPPDLLASRDDPLAAAAMRNHQDILTSRRALVRQRHGMQAASLRGLEDEINGSDAQVASGRDRLKILNEELRGMEQLLERGLVTKPRVLALRRDKAEIEGWIARYGADAGSTRKKLQETRYQNAEQNTSTETDVLNQLRDVQARKYNLLQKLATAEDTASRTEIRSPTDGSVVALKVHTIGGIISPGEVLMNIVPANDELVIQANVEPKDIDQVKAGLPASVWLTTGNHRNDQPLEGRISTVSADRIADPKTGNGYYLARVVIDKTGLRGRAIEPQPGMSADVMIKTGARSPLEYILGPLARLTRFATR